MTPAIRLTLLPLVLVTALSSCNKEDPKLLEKREQQKAEIVKLKGELTLLDEKLRNLPADVTSQLAEAERLVKEQTGEIAKLESDIAALNTRKRELQSQFDAYRAKYPVKTPAK